MKGPQQQKPLLVRSDKIHAINSESRHDKILVEKISNTLFLLYFAQLMRH